MTFREERSYGTRLKLLLALSWLLILRLFDD